jgi:hypothetical protein
MSNVNAKIETLVAENADLRASVAALIAAVSGTNENVAALAQAALARPARAPRGSRKSAEDNRTVTEKEVERVRSAGGFKAMSRFALLKQLVIAGPGEYSLGDMCKLAFLPGFDPRSALPLADAIARRLARKPLVGYVLTVDTDENEAEKTVLVFRNRVASDPVSTKNETEADDSAA